MVQESGSNAGGLLRGVRGVPAVLHAGPAPRQDLAESRRILDRCGEQRGVSELDLRRKSGPGGASCRVHGGRHAIERVAGRVLLRNGYFLGDTAANVFQDILFEVLNFVRQSVSIEE